MIHGKDVPVFTGDLMQLMIDAASFTSVAESIRNTGSDIHTGFQGLKSFYDAPEAEQLFATTVPVRDTADEFAGELESIGSALTSYEEEIRPLVQKLTSLAGQASAFEAENTGDDDWQKDHDKVEEHQAIWDGVAAAVAAFQAAERRAHNAIAALHGGARLEVNDGTKKANAYGWSEDDYAHSEKLPWGKPEQKKYEWYDPHNVKSVVWDGFIVDGVWGTVNGLLTLAGFHGWDEAKAAWKGLAQLGVGITLYTVPGLRDIPDDQLPGWMRNSKAVTREVGKSLIAYDEWKSGDKGRAAGLTLFNIGTIVAAPTKAGAAANAVSKTGKAINAVRQGGRLVDPMTYVTKAVGKAGDVAKIKIPDVIAGLKNVYAGSYAHLPDGSLRFPDGTVVRADNTVVLPDGTAFSEGGHYAADGTRLQHANDAPHEGTAADRTQHGDPSDTSLAQDHELAGVGGRGNELNATNQAGDPPGATGSGPSGHPGGHSQQHGGNGLPSSPEHGAHGPASGDGAAGGADHSARSDQRGGSGGTASGQDAAGGRGGSSADPHEIMRRQVERANNDPAYFKKYYQCNGYRNRTSIADESGFVPPQLVRDPTTGRWISASDAPPPLPERYLGGSLERGRETVSPEVVGALDAAAQTRHSAIAADQHAERQLKAAREAFEADANPANEAAVHTAEAAHKPLHKHMTKSSEDYGEAIAEHHVIPEHYPNATKEDLAGPENGNDQFDQVWRREDGGFVVVEAKGGVKTDLGHRNMPDGTRANQGTRQYFNDILREMRERGRENLQERRLARELKMALSQGKLDYILVRGNRNTGRYAGYTMRKFDIG
ncbi:hypothetical protein [Streptomyces sp. NPDC018031]|uniref:hypothetical protein n=1 Tax=Streptomyces sp. NPDC018031 TaxID=3365033 RepID=UPI0037B1FF2F